MKDPSKVQRFFLMFITLIIRVPVAVTGTIGLIYVLIVYVPKSVWMWIAITVSGACVLLLFAMAVFVLDDARPRWYVRYTRWVFRKASRRLAGVLREIPDRDLTINPLSDTRSRHAIEARWLNCDIRRRNRDSCAGYYREDRAAFLLTRFGETVVDMLMFGWIAVAIQGVFAILAGTTSGGLVEFRDRQTITWFYKGERT